MINCQDRGWHVLHAGVIHVIDTVVMPRQVAGQGKPGENGQSNQTNAVIGECEMSNIVETATTADNGVIHVIDRVILPQ